MQHPAKSEISELVQQTPKSEKSQKSMSSKGSQLKSKLASNLGEAPNRSSQAQPSPTSNYEINEYELMNKNYGNL